jgi:hypothetical protein
MNIAIFWLDEENKPQVKLLKENELLPALTQANALRDEGKHHVVISTNFGDSVGKRGVSDVLPEDYSWKKRRK